MKASAASFAPDADNLPRARSTTGAEDWTDYERGPTLQRVESAALISLNFQPGGVMNRARDLLAALLLLSAPVAANAQGTPAVAPSAAAVENGSTVKLEYTLKDDAGTVLDSNKGQEPLSFTLGGQQLMPGLEKQLSGSHASYQQKRIR